MSRKPKKKKNKKIFLFTIRNMRLDQSSSVHPNPKKSGQILKNLKNHFFFKSKFFRKYLFFAEKNAILLVLPIGDFIL